MLRKDRVLSCLRMCQGMLSLAYARLKAAPAGDAAAGAAVAAPAPVAAAVQAAAEAGAAAAATSTDNAPTAAALAADPAAPAAPAAAQADGTEHAGEGEVTAAAAATIVTLDIATSLGRFVLLLLINNCLNPFAVKENAIVDTLTQRYAKLTQENVTDCKDHRQDAYAGHAQCSDAQPLCAGVSPYTWTLYIRSLPWKETLVLCILCNMVLEPLIDKGPGDPRQSLPQLVNSMHCALEIGRPTSMHCALGIGRPTSMLLAQLGCAGFVHTPHI